MIRLIAAIDQKRGIAKDGKMPWSIPEDEQYFTAQTKLFGGNVLTGGETFRLAYHGPLKDRNNFIVTHNPEPISGATVVNDLQEFLKNFKNDLWVSGGAVVYAQTIQLANELYLTEIEGDFGCDKFFPDYKNHFKLAERSQTHTQNGYRFAYCRYVKN